MSERQRANGSDRGSNPPEPTIARIPHEPHESGVDATENVGPLTERPNRPFVGGSLSPDRKMERKHIAILAVVVVVALGGTVAALVTGFGPAPGGDGGSAGPSTPYENTVVVGDSGDSDSAGDDGGGADSGGTDAGSTATATPQEPFAFVIQNITECGRTCRVVNATIVNQQDSTAEGVTVRSEIYTGGDKIWEGSSEAGTLASGERYTDTKRVELSYGEAYSVQQNDGQITIKTFVQTDETTYVFTDERNVN